MWSRSKLYLLQRLQRFYRMRISVRLTLIYGSIMCCVLLFTSLATGFGIYFSLYHEAEVEMGISIDNVARCLHEDDHTEIIGQVPENNLPGHPGPESLPDDMAKSPAENSKQDKKLEVEAVPSRDDVLMPGVVLRVTNETGRIVYETDKHYPSIQTVENHLSNIPIWFTSNDAMKIASIRNMFISYETMDFEYDGHIYTMHFFKTITAERQFLQMLQRFLILTNVLGLLIALLVGHFMSRRILKPIRTMTATARKIEVSDLGRRLEVPPSNDELTELAQTFNLMLDRLQQGFEQQRRFVSDASHELRTPVTVIRGYSDMLSRWGRQDSEALDEGIAAIRSEAEDMQELIEKLLFLARADQKRQVLHKEFTEMQELVADVAKKMRVIAKKHEVKLLSNAAGTAYVDSVTIKQMMRVFLENAMKYTPPGGHITIASRRIPDSNLLCLEIADDGIGIAKKDQAKIFERFFRVDSARTKEQGGVGGTGLGLSIAKWIAVQHGIEIGIDSDLGKGTKIILKVPLA
jgi:signal transduction histidine kinase